MDRNQAPLCFGRRARPSSALPIPPFAVSMLRISILSRLLWWCHTATPCPMAMHWVLEHWPIIGLHAWFLRMANLGVAAIVCATPLSITNLYRSVVDRQPCKLNAFGSIPNGCLAQCSADGEPEVGGIRLALCRRTLLMAAHRCVACTARGCFAEICTQGLRESLSSRKSP